MKETILIIILFVIFIAIAVTCYLLIKKYEKRQSKKSVSAKFNDKPRLKLNLPFLSSNEVKFLAVFQNSLPSEYVAFPKVCMKNIVKPDGSLIIYNEIENEQLDIVVFLKTKMQPVMAVDLLDPSKGDRNSTKNNEFVTKSLKSINLPVLTLALDHDYEKLELLNMFLDKMDPVSIAQLKKQN